MNYTRVRSVLGQAHQLERLLVGQVEPIVQQHVLRKQGLAGQGLLVQLLVQLVSLHRQTADRLKLNNGLLRRSRGLP